MSVVVYYRGRPSESDASELALRLQREAVQREVEDRSLEVVATFTEDEGEQGAETWPAYVAAVNAAVALFQAGTGFELLVASNAAIGSGEVFHAPEVEDDHLLLHYKLSAPSIEIPSRIEVPPGAPGPLCLHACHMPGQLQTLIYLCNAGPDPLYDLTVSQVSVSLSELYTQQPPPTDWTDTEVVQEGRPQTLAMGMCELVGAISLNLWDIVSRYRIVFTDSTGMRWATEALDSSFTSSPETCETVWRLLAAAALLAPDQVASAHAKPAPFEQG